MCLCDKGEFTHATIEGEKNKPNFIFVVKQTKGGNFSENLNISHSHHSTRKYTDYAVRNMAGLSKKIIINPEFLILKADGGRLVL